MKKILSTLLILFCLLALSACSSEKTEENEEQDAGQYSLTIWVEGEECVELTKKQIADFEEANPGVTVNANVVSAEVGAKLRTMSDDYSAFADIYMFPQDQLATLKKAGLIQTLDETESAKIVAENDDISIKAVSADGNVYAYPITSDNGYFLYYDKSVISEDQLDDLATLVQACEDADMLFCMDCRFSAWYSASFFIATGCTSEWISNSDGDFTDYFDTFNSAAGLTAMKGMSIFIKSPMAYSTSDCSYFNKDAAVVVSGTWGASEAKKILKDNLGVADLPSFTVDGNTYHMGSFAGNKLIGIKPQTDEEKNSLCHKLAEYLSGEKCQLERYTELGWGPSNLNAQANETVKSDAALLALQEQSDYAIPQGQYPAEWWNIAVELTGRASKATSENDLLSSLNDYANSLEVLYPKKEYVFIGSWNGWDNSEKASAKMYRDGNTLTITLDVAQSDYMAGRIVAVGELDYECGCQQVSDGVDLIVPYDKTTNHENNIIFKESGNYTVNVNLVTGDIKIVKN